MPGAPRDRPLTTGDFRALARFRYALRTFQHFSEQAARNAGLTPAQHQLLLVVKGYGGQGLPPLTDVADMLKLRLHSASELVDRAEANGLVARQIDSEDRRRVLLALTPLGERHLGALSMLHREELRRFKREMSEILHELDP